MAACHGERLSVEAARQKSLQKALAAMGSECEAGGQGCRRHRAEPLLPQTAVRCSCSPLQSSELCLSTLGSLAQSHKGVSAQFLVWRGTRQLKPARGFSLRK